MRKRAINANKPHMNSAMEDKCLMDSLIEKYNQIAKNKYLQQRKEIDADYTIINDQLLSRAYDGLLNDIERLKRVIREEEEQDTMLYGEYEGEFPVNDPQTINGWSYTLNNNELTVTLADKNATELPENLPYNYIKDSSDNEAYAVTSISGMFSGCANITEIDMNDWDTSLITDMSSAFAGCTSLKVLNIDKWNTYNVTTLRATFNNCSALSTLNISEWDVFNVSSLQDTFSGSGITALNLDNWNTNKMWIIQNAFANCKDLTTLSLRNWNLISLTKTDSLFSGCNALETLDLSGWCNIYLPANDTANTVFSGCNSLKTLDLTYWNTAFGSDAFSGCVALSMITINRISFASVYSNLLNSSGWIGPDENSVSSSWKSAWTSIATFTKSTQ